MHRLITELAQQALRVQNFQVEVQADFMALIIQKAVVHGHQQCLQSLRDRGMLHDPLKGTAPVAATRTDAEQRLGVGVLRSTFDHRGEL